MSINAKPRGFMFDEVEFSTPDKSAFDLSQRKVCTYQMDYLYPIFLHHALPGETYEMNLHAFFRTTPLVSPIMNDIDVKFYWFWVPYRIVFKKFRKLISNGDGTVAINDPRAMQSLVGMPFVTSHDLVARGNHSLTSHYRHWNCIRPVIQEGNINFHANDFSISSDINYTHGMAPGSLADHLGIPTMMTSGQAVLNPIYYANSAFLNMDWNSLRNGSIITEGSTDFPTISFNSLPFRAYNKIWYDWFRDENVFADPNKTPLTWDYFDGSSWKIGQSETDNLILFDEDTEYYNNDRSKFGDWDNLLNVGLLKKCWTKDYFTSSLLSPQRGQDVVLPLGNTAPVKFTFNAADIVSNSDGSVVGNAEVEIRTNGDGKSELRVVNSGNNVPSSIDNSKNLSCDLSQASSATLNSLRVANAMQKFCEKMARCGSRYVNQMQAMFDVEVPDAISDRASLISTSRCPVQVTTNTSTADTQIADTFTPQGTQAANATGSDTNGFRLTTNEHGMILGLMCIEPRIFYGSSLSRDWFRYDWLDFAWPSFANLGEQTVWNGELIPNSKTSVDHEALKDYSASVAWSNLNQMRTFGYQSRYCEYKYKSDEVHGRFKTDMQYYHLSRFPNDVSITDAYLNEPFLLCNSEDYQNIFHEVLNQENGLTTDHFLFDLDFNFKGIRPLPLYGTPTL